MWKAVGEGFVESLAEKFLRSLFLPHQSQLQRVGRARFEREDEMRRALGADLLWVHRLGTPPGDILMKGILHERRHVRLIPQALGVALVLSEECVRLAFPGEEIVAQRTVLRAHQIRVLKLHGGTHRCPIRLRPTPRIPEPQGRQQMERRRLWPTIRNRNLDAGVLRRRLRILGKDIEVTVVIKGTRIRQFQLGPRQSAFAILPHQTRVGKLGLRILVERLGVGMGRRRIKVVVALLAVLAVIPFRPGEPKEPLLQNRIAPIP